LLEVSPRHAEASCRDENILIEALALDSQQ